MPRWQRRFQEPSPGHGGTSTTSHFLIMPRLSGLLKQTLTCNKAAALLLATSACLLAPRRAQRLMTWAASPSSNEELVASLQERGILQSPETAEAMLAVDRGQFVRLPEAGYLDVPSPIGYGATISAPHMHGYALELLREHLRPGAKVLDVGSGSGYLTAVFARMVTRGGAPGVAVGVEHIPELVDWSRHNVGQDPQLQALADRGSLRLVEGDGMRGWAEEAPYDAIHVGAAAAVIPPALVEQLRPGGRAVVPVGPPGGAQSLAVLDKRADGTVLRRDALDVAFVPLTSKERQLRRG